MAPLKDKTSEVDATNGLPPRAVPEPATVRRQLERLLASPHFRSSKRCQSLLTHVVESSLEGSLDRVKERIIGIEVFGRDPGYDTNRDSVVRTTAAEVRKRLAQYYLEPNHQQEIRFLLPAGSYVPEFRLPAPAVAVAAAPTLPAMIVVPDVAPRPAESQWRWVWVIPAVVLVAGSIYWFLPHFRTSEVDAFWRPLIEDRADVVICIEQPLRIYAFDGPRVDDLNTKMVGTTSTPPASAESLQDTRLNLSELKTVGNRYFSFGDVVASVRVAEWLAKKGKPFQLLGDRATSYRDLRGKPAVLVGEFNNQWTNGLIRGLRYYLEKNAETRTYDVRDRQNGGKVIASVTREVTRPAEYAIVSRVFDSSTEKTVIAIAGMTYAGTGAVGDFLTTQSYMHDAFQKAEPGWSRKNIQVVLETALVSGTAGPPKVVAMHFW